MSKRLKKKALFMVAVEIVCIILLGAFLMTLQTDLSIKNQQDDIKEKIEEIQTLIDQGDAADASNTESYDEVYKSKAASVAYMAQKDKTFEATNAYLKDLANLMNITNILIIDKSGKVQAAAQPSEADFTRARFNQLRTTFETGEPSEPFNVIIGEKEHRYYGAKIDDKLQAVVEHDPAELTELQDSTSSWKSILSKISVGLEGYAFAVSSQDYTFQYHPDEELEDTDALGAGLTVSQLEDKHVGWMNINGERFYGGVAKIDADNAYVVFVVPEHEIISSRNITVAIILFIFFVVITIVIVYAILMSADEERKHASGETGEDGEALAAADADNGKKYRYNKNIGKKISAISIIGLILILVVSFYMQTLFSISRYSISITQRVTDVEKNINRNKKEVDSLVEQYNRRYLNKALVASRILSNNPELWEKAELAELSRVLGIEFLLIFDRNGKEVVSDSSYVNFELSQNPEDQSYEFNPLLQGVEYVIQDAQPDELSGNFYQYIGATLKDEEGNADGFVQIAVDAGKLEEVLETTQLSAVLQGVKIGTNGFTFAVNKKDQTFSYYPKEKMIGRSVLEYGLPETALCDQYNDYLEVAGKKYFGSSLETDTDYIYAVIPADEMDDNTLEVALATGVLSLICLLLVCLILSFEKGKEAAAEGEKRDPKHNSSIDVTMPDGSTRRTDTVASRWSNLTLKWTERTPEQQVASILGGLVSIFALAICIMVLFRETLLESTSILRYVVDGKWSRGVNIFAITGCLMIICVLAVAIMLLRRILKVLSRTFGAKGETICRLLSSFLKYVTVIAGLYYCFALFGVDTKTLLASAGIMSLVIGLGAKSLVEDILAGLFIIFEGDFRVGDIVTIGDWRGTVVEIGIRTTKVEEPGNNVKVFNNSTISGVINMTKKTSVAFCDVGIEYGESLERVENILEKELPNIQKRCPAILEGPFYKGVTALADNSVNIKIVASCAEADRAQVTRDLNREMKLIFDKHDVNIPFPQVVLNQPKEYQEATYYEKMRADKFAREQQELAKNLFDDDDDRD